MKRPFVIITTRLPPAPCGIGTYSWLLRRNWPNEPKPVEFLVMDEPADPRLLPNSDRVTSFHGHSGKLGRELDRIGAADVLLHYAGRAYHRWGCPFWLPGLLADWKRKHPGSRLMIFAHELPGELSIASRHFWLGKANAWILRRLASIGDVLVTNTQSHAARWQDLSLRDDIHVVPVGSNIEPLADTCGPRLHGEFLIFGLSFGRLQTLELFAADIRRWQAEGRITKLHLVGPDGDEFSRRADRLMRTSCDEDSVIRHGVLPTTEVARLLRRAEFALTNVTEQTWSKSGIFMACAANECPIVIHAPRPASPPLSHAVNAGELNTISKGELAERSAALVRWYKGNATWSAIAKRLASLEGRAPCRPEFRADGTAPVAPPPR